MKGKAFLVLGIVGLGGVALYFAEKKGLISSSTFTVKVLSALSPTHALADAIATAEGFYVPGSRPARNHNPGDMTADLIGKSIGKDGPFVVYSTDDDGWENLYAQIDEWFAGTSAHADSSSTIADLGSFYTDTERQSWIDNVAGKLGVSPDTPISSIGG